MPKLINLCLPTSKKKAIFYNEIETYVTVHVKEITKYIYMAYK